MSMGSDVNYDDFDRRLHIAATHAMVKEAARIRAALCANRGLTPSQACQVGCKVCGVIDASPARCEHCTPPVMRDDGFLCDSEGG